MTHRIHSMSLAKVYPLYLAKVARKGRTQAELDTVILWLTGHDAAGLAAVLERGDDFARFFAEAPALNPNRARVTGVICGVRIEEIAEPLMREIRILDKLVDELAKGRPLEKVLRQG
ncbi:DUF2200 domain-containing protein [Rhodobacter calidifons]|uniref:DUF2200 domain-containing protein n=1 Tax=Rhodobacter calidifons TaxID=2715277 RepID=A0ABX0GC80_9RHOB|nr:DUF2200 domain-containing protein [Rhodobacter calidifons]NHB78479.1 DUF2200 domain-containing protein [Rhodobacter calidifons]